MHGTMSLVGRSAVALVALATAIAAAASCTQDFDQFFQGATGAGAGGTGGIGGGSGECTVPEECPGLDSTCQYRSCVDGQCGTQYAAAGTACTEDDGAVCSGTGQCVECTNPSHCAGGETCANNQCVPEACVNGQLDGQETDVDCGGSQCNPCQNGLDCLVATDCYSRFCEEPGAGGAGGASAGGVCAPCTGDGDCAPVTDTWCDGSLDGGTCADQKDDGDACAGPNECLSGSCPASDGVCCDTACSATCQACLLAKTGTQNGTCALVQANTDPDTECTAAAQSTCGSSGAGCTGTSTSCILYDSTTECAPQGCTGSTLVAARLCNGSGTCLPPASSSACPNGYMCNAAGTACRTACTDNAHCVGAYWCDVPNTSCEPDKADGQPCSSLLECQNAHCPAPDNVCCDAACGGTCVSCLNADHGGGDGNCLPMPAGTDPDQECTPPCGEVCNGSISSPDCTAATCETCQTLYGSHAAVFEICTDTYNRCILRTDNSSISCEAICQTGGGECISYSNDNPNGTCGVGALSDCVTGSYGSGICTCSHGCGLNPPCPTGQTCNNGTCS